jgi:hypothetical protein
MAKETPIKAGQPILVKIAGKIQEARVRTMFESTDGLRKSCLSDS